MIAVTLSKTVALSGRSTTHQVDPKAKVSETPVMVERVMKNDDRVDPKNTSRMEIEIPVMVAVTTTVIMNVVLQKIIVPAINKTLI